VYKAAGESVGLKGIGVGDRYRLKMYLEELKRSTAQLKDIEQQMGALLEQIPYTGQISPIESLEYVVKSIENIDNVDDIIDKLFTIEKEYIRQRFFK